MSYSGGQSNPPWQRNTLGNAGQSQQMQNMSGAMQNPNSGMHYQSQPMYGQNIGMSGAPQNQAYGMGQMQSTQASLFPPAVSYPATPRSNLNTVAFAGSAGAPVSSTNNYNAFGIVTKVHNDCGFVDDEVFFHKNVCKGAVPKVGERVLVEASFNQNSPFKWNATRIQIMSGSGNNSGGGMPRAPQPPPLMGSGSSGSGIKGGSGYNAVPPPNEYAGQFGRGGGSRRVTSPSRSRPSPDRHSSRKESRHSRDEEEAERKRRREERERERRERDKRESLEKRERSPIRRPSPKRRRRRTMPRYMVQIPKITLTMNEADVLELRRRYTNLYVPSDFFFTEIKWFQAFPPNNPFSIQRPCSFHIMHKTVDPPKDTIFAIDPPDADYLFSAKVMLMGVPPIAEIYQKCLMEDNEDENRDFVHPTRLINFLVGVRGKNETMAIGGPWSPSLDGENPQSDPSVLIKTAIRTCKYLTGVDLSGCTQWYRFVELYYRRPETIHKGHLIPARVETVVIFLPDINSCMPTRSEWDTLQCNYKATLEDVLNEADCSSDFTLPDGVLEAPQPPILGPLTGAIEATNKNGSIASPIGEAAEDAKDQSSTSMISDETGNEKEEGTGKCEPTCYSDLDPKTMKLQDLRDELTARNLSSKGLKPQLIARLTKVLRTEKSEAENKDDVEDIEMAKSEEAGEQDNLEENEAYEDHTEMDMNDIVVLDEYDSTKPEEVKTSKEPKRALDEKERQQLERRYKLPENPHIIVHPSATAKSGKFDCAVQSLSVLLDYRPEDTKEHSFEVALFAELFSEMLMRDFGFNIYKEVALLPEKPREKEEPTKKKDEPADNSSTAVESEKETNEKAAKDPEIKRESNNIAEKNKERRISDSEKSDRKSASVKDRKAGKRAHDDDSDDDNYSMKSGERKRRPKPIVIKPDLLLSFIYFDTTHCGYIFEKDVEELFYIIGLNLSRAQVRKLLGKVVSRDAFYYRKLTDKPKEEETTDETKNSKKEDLDVKNDGDLSLLAKGNKILLPIFKENNSGQSAAVASESATVVDVNTLTGMVSFNGGLIDIGKLVDQMKRSERAREETEQILSDLRKQNADLLTSQSKSSSRIKDLQSDVKSLSRKLNESEQSLSSISRKNNDYYNILSSIYDRVTPVFVKSERSSKSDSGRDKDKERERERDRDKEDRKDREREKEKDKEDTKDLKDDRKDRDKEDEKDRKDRDRDETKDTKDDKERKDREKEKDKKDLNNTKESKDKKESNDSKELKDKKNSNDLKESKDKKDSNHPKESKEKKDSNDSKESKDKKDSNDTKDKKESKDLNTISIKDTIKIERKEDEVKK